MKNKHAGSSFENFLHEEGIAVAVDAAAVKRAFVIQLEQRMKKAHKNKSAFREALGSPTTTARLFSENTGTALETIVRAAAIVNCELEIKLKPRFGTR
jgi:antitoxin HicB